MAERHISLAAANAISPWQRFKAQSALWALRTLGRDRLDYLTSNTMTVVNRRLNDVLWTYDLKAVVTAVHDEAAGVKTFVLQPNQHWRGLQAGQYVEVTVDAQDAAGRALTRCYSPALTADGGLSITVKRTGKGEVSGWMHDWLQPGRVLGLSQAQGQFYYRGQSRLLFISAGSGITPCHAMIADLLARRADVDVQLHARFATQADVIFADTLRDWQQRLPVEIALSREQASGYVAPFSVADFAARFPDFRERDIYLCGPAGFMEEVVQILQALDYDLSKLHSERFSLPVATPAGAVAACSELRFEHLHRTVALTAEDAGLTLLEVAERHGVPVESGCRKGMCGTCKLTLKSGQVQGNTLGAAVYLCTSHPASTCVVLDA